MYSPKIAEHRIPPIYRLARARGQHMTTLVNQALARYLTDQAGQAHQGAESGSEAPVPHAAASWPGQTAAPIATLRPQQAA
ncbi:MAG: hypothetical protein ACR2NO_08580 [Chloroflexota bacterium]